MPNTNEKSKSPTIANGLKWMYLSSVAQVGLRIFVLAVLARLLLPSDFGLLGLALIFTSCAERLGQVGVGPALVQKNLLTDADIRTGTALSLLSGILIAIALTVIAPFVGTFFDAPRVVGVLQILAFGFIIDGFGVVSDSLLQRQLRFRAVMFSENLSYVVGNVCVGTCLAWLGYGVWSLVFSNLAMKIVRVVLLRRAQTAPWVGSLDSASTKALLNTGVGFSLGRILSFLALQGDNFVVGRLLGVDVLGMYTRAYQLMTLPATYLGQALERVLFPAMAKKQNDKSKLIEIFYWNIELVTLIALPVSVGMFFLSEEIIAVLFGSKWVSVAPTLTILSLGVFFRTGYKCSDTLARSCGAVYQHALRQAVYCSLVIGGAIVGSLLSGLEGVAVAVVISVAVNYALMTLLSAKLLQLPLKKLVKPHLPGIWVSLCIAVALAVFLPILRTFSTNSVVVLGLGSCIAGTALLLGLLVAWGDFKSPLLSVLVRRIPLERLGWLGFLCSKVARAD